MHAQADQAKLAGPDPAHAVHTKFGGTRSSIGTLYKTGFISFSKPAYAAVRIRVHIIADAPRRKTAQLHIPNLYVVRMLDLNLDLQL